MRVLTYNIHKGIGGVDRAYDLDRIIAILKHCRADVAMLQEVDHGARRSRYHHQSQVLAEALDMPYVSVGINHRLRRRGAYGNVTLSHWPIVGEFNLDLTLPMKKRRGALYTRIDTPDLGPVDVFNFHLGLVHVERVRQVQRILESPCICEAPHQPAIIAGDSNDWRGRICERIMSPQGFAEVGVDLNGKRTATFPAFRPMLSLDRIYYRHLQPQSLLDLEHEFIGHASDHRPLVVDFRTEP